MDFSLIRLRFRSVGYVLFISGIVLGPLVGLGAVTDRVVLVLTLVSVGRDLSFL